MNAPLLVCGGAGFIGSCFVRQQIARAPIVVLDALTYAGHRSTLASVMGDTRLTFVAGDIGDRPLVERLLAEHQPRAIVNFAAESHVDRSIDGPAPFVQTNVVGCWNLLDAAFRHWQGLDGERRAGFRFLQISTDEVYGSLGATGRFHETTPFAPNSPYAASKAAADHFVRAYHHTYGFPSLVTHASNNYGPYQFPEKLIPLMTLNALNRQPLPIYGDGLQVRDWLHVEDHCDALWLVLTRGRPGETYNIGGDCEQTNRHLVEAICDLVDELAPDSGPSRRQLMQSTRDRPGHDRRYALAITKITAELGWQPRREFPRLLRETVKWYLAHQPWVEMVGGDQARRRRGLLE